MRYRAAILTDLDNTIYNWVDYFAPCFRAMVHVLARETGLSEESITEDFKEVFSRHGSLEYAFSIQELTLCRDRPDAEVAELIRLAKGAFSRVRQKRLAAYPGVKETLLWAKTEAIAVVGVSNSPIFQARMRLRQLRLDHLFAGLAAWEGFDIPKQDPFADPVRDRALRGGWPTRLPMEWPFPSEQLKPSPSMYSKVVADLQLQPRDIWVIGDSLHKDVRPALILGMVGVWAKYGLSFEPKNFQTLLAITHWTQERIEDTYSQDVVRPDATVQEFSELRRLIPSRQPSLFDEPESLQHGDKPGSTR